MSIWTNIMNGLIAGVDSMTTPTFNSNYDNVNEYRPANKTYPSTVIEFPDEFYRGSLENVIDSYSGDVEVLFKTTVDDSTPDVDEAMDDVIEDFKRLLEDEHDALQILGMVVHELEETGREYTLIRKRPGIVTIKFNFFYRVRRSNPTVTT